MFRSLNNFWKAYRPAHRPEPSFIGYSASPEVLYTYGPKRLVLGNQQSGTVGVSFLPAASTRARASRNGWERDNRPSHSQPKIYAIHPRIVNVAVEICTIIGLVRTTV